MQGFEGIIGLVSPLIIMLAIFYVIVFIPENRRKKKYNAMISGLKLNDEVMTRGGIMGKITNIQDDHILLQTGPDRARIKIAKSGIANVITEAKTE